MPNAVFGTGVAVKPIIFGTPKHVTSLVGFPRTSTLTVGFSDRPFFPFEYTVTDSATPTPQTDKDAFVVRYGLRPRLEGEYKTSGSFPLGIWQSIPFQTPTYEQLANHVITFVAIASYRATLPAPLTSRTRRDFRFRWVFTVSPKIVSEWTDVITLA